MKNGFRIKFLWKVLYLFTLSFVFQLIFSCVSISNEPTIVDYNSLTFKAFDNSGRFAEANTSKDTVYSEALGFKLTLFDSLVYSSSNNSPNFFTVFSFQTLQADDINPNYIPKNKMIDIKVKTLMDLNENIKSGDDISAHILCSAGNTYDLYNDLAWGIAEFNSPSPYFGKASLILLLKESITSNSAHFEVIVTFDNGLELRRTTEILTILRP